MFHHGRIWMFKKILFHAVIGGTVFILGACLHDFANIRDVGNFLAICGVVYAALTTILLLGANFNTTVDNNSVLSYFGKLTKDYSSSKARDELFEYKKLLDSGVLTQEEFDTKITKLKKKIL